jgi:hypothetical protein
MDEPEAKFLPDGDDGDEIEMVASRQCFFCGADADPEETGTVMYMALVESYDDGSEIDVTLGWTCHRECVRNARHPDVPEWWERPTGAGL